MSLRNLTNRQRINKSGANKEEHNGKLEKKNTLKKEEMC
jgi:hypothetical protein